MVAVLKLIGGSVRSNTSNMPNAGPEYAGYLKSLNARFFSLLVNSIDMSSGVFTDFYGR